MAQNAADIAEILRGKTITLDAPEDEPVKLSERETTELWQQWLVSGEQGPISDDGDSV